MEVALPSDSILPFLTGTNALFTMVGKESRYTYRVTQDPKNPNVLKLGVLSGPNNTQDYRRLGSILKDSKEIRSYTPDAPSVKAFRWVFERAKRNMDIAPVQVLHHGRCCLCGRTLTTPESIRSGIGPVCAERFGF
jgi:hypothetical protein